MAPIPASLLKLFPPLEPWLGDASVRRVLVDGPDRVFVERDGALERVEVAYPEHQLVAGLNGLSKRAGKAFDRDRPCLEAMLKDGTRFLALRAPVVEGGPVLAIVRPAQVDGRIEALSANGEVDPRVAELLRAGLAAGLNIAVVGAPGGLRDRLVAALVAASPDGARMASVQVGAAVEAGGAAMLRLTPHKAGGEGRSVSVGDLLYATGRFAFDRVVVTDVRMADAWDAVSLLASRDTPVLLALPGATADDGVARLEALARAGASRQRERAVPGLVAAGLDLVATCLPRAGGRACVELHAVRPRAAGPVCEPLIELGEAGLESRAEWARLRLRLGLEVDAGSPRVDPAPPTRATPPPVREAIAAEPTQAETPAAKGVPGRPALPKLAPPMPVVAMPAKVQAEEAEPGPLESGRMAARGATPARPRPVPVPPAPSSDAPPPLEPDVDPLDTTQSRTRVETKVEQRLPEAATAAGSGEAVEESIDISVELPPDLDEPTQALPAVDLSEDASDVTAALDVPPEDSAETAAERPVPRAPSTPPEGPAPNDPLRRLLQSLDDDDDEIEIEDPDASYEDEEVTIVTHSGASSGEGGEMLSKKTFSQILRNLGAAADSVESTESDWPGASSRNAPPSPPPRSRRDRNTVVSDDE